MKERPIIFSGDMVRAILAGRKTQTRRILKVETGITKTVPRSRVDDFAYYEIEGKTLGLISPYGRTGDRLWVRETWAKTCISPDGVCDGPDCDYCSWNYRADDPTAKYPGDWPDNTPAHEAPPRWKPSIHMPRLASRLLLDITDVRIERLQNISEHDAMAEGVEVIDNEFFGHPVYRDYQKPGFGYDTARLSYYSLWCSIYSQEFWHKNPLVWVVDFKQID
jgi:hypothetical protein